MVVMGVTGCGKSAVGEALASVLGAQFIEGDALHPPENIARMSAGLPLTDAFRAGWLDAIAARMEETLSEGRAVIVTCSALKRRYRDRLRQVHGRVVFLHLVVDKETARARVAARKNHFMPASLVDSQFADLEALGDGEDAIALDATRPIPAIVEEAAEFVCPASAR